MILQKIVGAANLPEFNKFRIYLECGHSILYDHSVDFIDEYFGDKNLICYKCQENLYKIIEDYPEKDKKVYIKIDSPLS